MFVFKSCEYCGRQHPRSLEADFDPPQFCTDCRIERRERARDALGLAGGVATFSSDGRYVLPPKLIMDSQPKN